MAQLTIRLDDELARALKAHAAGLGVSVNGWVVAVLGAALDPDLEDPGLERTRGWLERAGLLATPLGRPRSARPDHGKVARARAAAGKGTSLSQLVSDGRS